MLYATGLTPDTIKQPQIGSFATLHAYNIIGPITTYHYISKSIPEIQTFGFRRSVIRI